MASIFNDLGKKISQTSQEAVKKAKELAEIAKLNSSISDEERNINKYFTQMGEKYLELYGDTTEEPFASYCESIRASKMKIKNLEKEIKLIRNIKVCTNCGAEYSNNAIFCSSCGHKQEVPDVEKITEPVEIINDDNEVINQPYESATETMDIENESIEIVTEIIDEEIEGSDI
jgi:ribosomal protein L40E